MRGHPVILGWARGPQSWSGPSSQLWWRNRGGSGARGSQQLGQEEQSVAACLDAQSPREGALGRGTHSWPVCTSPPAWLVLWAVHTVSAHPEPPAGPTHCLGSGTTCVPMAEGCIRGAGTWEA